MELKELGLQRVSFSEKQKLNNIITKEGDKGTRGLLIEFEKGLKCMLYMEIEGAIYEIEGVEVEEGLYEVIYPSNLKKGIVSAEIKFYKGKEILSNYIYDTKVVRNLFNLKNGITIVDEVNLADSEVIETTVDYYDEFERLDYKYGRNLFRMSNMRNWAMASNKIGERSNYRGFIAKVEPNQRYTLSRDSKENNRFRYYFLDEEPEVGMDLPDEYRHDYDLKIEGFKTKEYTEWLFVYLDNTGISIDELPNIKLEKGNTATDWTPAPEDLNNLKGVKYNLSTKLSKNQYYTISVDGTFNEDDFIGVFLGNNKFIGYLQDNKITFKSNINIDDDYIIVKSLNEEGVINHVKIKEGNNGTEKSRLTKNTIQHK